MRSPLRLGTKVTFFSPKAEERTSTGGSKIGWQEEFFVYAAIRYPRGNEDTSDERPRGARPAILTMRKLARVNSVKIDWIVRFGGRQYALRELPRDRDDAATMEMSVEAEV